MKRNAARYLLLCLRSRFARNVPSFSDVTRPNCSSHSIPLVVVTYRLINGRSTNIIRIHVRSLDRSVLVSGAPLTRHRSIQRATIIAKFNAGSRKFGNPIRVWTPLKKKKISLSNKSKESKWEKHILKS